MNKPTETKPTEGRGGTGVAFEDIQVRKVDPNTIDSPEKANQAFSDLSETVERAVGAGKLLEEVSEDVLTRVKGIEEYVAKASRPTGTSSEISRRTKRMIEASPRRLVDEPGELTFAERLGQIPHADARSDEQLSEFRKLNDQMVGIRTLFVAKGLDPKTSNTWKRYKEALGEIQRGYGATDADGNYLVPTMYSTDFDELLESKPGLAQLFTQKSLTARNTETYYMSSGSKAYAAPDNTADISESVTLSNAQWAKKTFTAQKLVTGAFIDQDWEEDQMVADMPELMAEQARAIRNAENDVILNGHQVTDYQDHFEYVSGSSSDYAVTSSVDARKLQNGIRRYVLNVASAALKTGMAVPYLNTMLASIGAQTYFGAVSPSRVAWIIPMNVWAKLVVMLDASSGTRVHTTWDVYGPEAFNRTGVLGAGFADDGRIGSFLGSPVYATEQMSGTVNASGIYDGVTATKTAILRVVTDEFVFASRSGVRQRLSTEVGLPMLKDYIQTVRRFDFLPKRGALSATYAPAHLWYNLTQ